MTTDYDYPRDSDPTEAERRADYVYTGREGTAMGGELYDGENGDRLGFATAEQREASDISEAQGEHGLILIDGDGDVIGEAVRTAP